MTQKSLPVNKPRVATGLKAAGLSSALILAGMYLIAPNEGLVLETYLDPVNIATVCYGQTGKDIKLGQKFTEQECLEKLAKGLTEHNDQLMKVVKVPLSDGEHAAYLSFVYNVGIEKFKRSTMLVKLNDEQRLEACAELKKWVYAGSNKLKGLISRRGSEYEMCVSGVIDSEK